MSRRRRQPLVGLLSWPEIAAVTVLGIDAGLRLAAWGLRGLCAALEDFDTDRPDPPEENR